MLNIMEAAPIKEVPVQLRVIQVTQKYQLPVVLHAKSDQLGNARTRLLTVEQIRKSGVMIVGELVVEM